MDKPDISVILTAYNVERYIGRALESALGQQGVALEVIVVDDCSTDGTWEIISKNTDPRVKRLRLAKNSGPGAARNMAIAQATGQWLAILDGDDIFLPGRLLRCIEKVTAHHADIVVDNLTVYREADGKTFPMFPPVPFSRLATLDLATFIKETLPGSGNYTLGYLKPFFSAEFLRLHKLSYDPDLKIGEDYLLLAEMLAIGARCAVEPSQGYQYTARAGSISHRLSLADLTRIQEGDARLLARHHLSPVAMQAQKGRENNLKKVYAFTLLVDAIKQKNASGVLKAIAACPACIWLLRAPIGARVERMLKYVYK